MRKLKGFTLVELLVVISIIAMLLAVLIPSLQKARQVAQRVICSNHQKTFSLANAAYATQFDGRYVPVRYVDSSGSKQAWVSNTTFRKLCEFDKYLKTEDYQLNKNGTKTILYYDLPNAYLCPSDVISPYKKNRFFRDNAYVLLSYGYNYTEWSVSGQWDPWAGYPTDAGHKAANIKTPASKLAFTDSVDWWVCWNGADYAGVESGHNSRQCWNEMGQANVQAYKDGGLHGPVLYRHSEGAVVAFYDGHCKYMKKQEMYVLEDRTSSPKKPGMWVSDITLYQKNGQP